MTAKANSSLITSEEQELKKYNLDIITLFRSKPRTGELNDLLIKEDELKRYLHPEQSSLAGKLPMDVLLHMLFTDKYFSYDFKDAFKNVFTMTSLKGLDMRGYNLTSIPPEIGNLVNLEVLVLSDNQLKALPAEIFKLKNLKLLDVKGNQINLLPPQIGDLHGLETLLLDENPITGLPSELRKLKNLKELSVFRCDKLQIAHLTVVYDLPRLISLNISYINMSTTPIGIGKLMHLERLYMSGTQLRTLPSDISLLTNLTEITLAKQNQLDMQQAFTVLSKLPRLSKIVLMGSELKVLPPEIGLLTQLKNLTLYDNDLEILPEQFASLSKLENLNLGKNNFEGIPLPVFKLTELQYLSVAANDIYEIPVQIAGLKDLKELYMKSTLLSEDDATAFKGYLPKCKLVYDDVEQ